MKVGGKFSEEDYQCQQTQFLLDSFGEDITLKREPDFEDDGGGGLVRPDEEDSTKPPQVFWFYEAAPIAHVARGTNFQEIINMGQRITTAFILLGLPDADIKQDDEFVRGEFEYKVVFVHDDRSFQTIAELERIGSGNGES